MHVRAETHVFNADIPSTLATSFCFYGFVSTIGSMMIYNSISYLRTYQRLKNIDRDIGKRLGMFVD